MDHLSAISGVVLFKQIRDVVEHSGAVSYTAASIAMTGESYKEVDTSIAYVDY